MATATASKPKKEVTPKKVTFKSINFSDIIPLATPNVDGEAENVKTIKQYATELTQLEAIASKYDAEAFTNIRSKFYDEIYTPKTDKIRKDIIISKGALPKELENRLYGNRYSSNNKYYNMKSDTLTKVSKDPCVLGSSVKEIVNKFNFVLMPWEYVDYSTVEKLDGYDYRVTGAFKERCMTAGYTIYIVSPIGFYSLTRHVGSDKNYGIYAGMNTVLVNSLLLNIPMFRDITKRLTKVENDVNNINNTMNQMQTQIKSLQNQMHDVMRTQLQQAAEIRGLHQSIAGLNEELQIIKCMLDPIMIAVPSNVDVNSPEFDTALCKVGPCWGPDFTEAVSMALGLSVLKGQREMLKAHFKNQYEN